MATKILTTVGEVDSADSFIVNAGNAVKQITKAKVLADIGGMSATAIADALAGKVDVGSIETLEVAPSAWTASVTTQFYSPITDSPFWVSAVNLSFSAA